jgi:DNA-binding CsgD family transcriptional regulator
MLGVLASLFVSPASFVEFVFVRLSQPAYPLVQVEFERRGVDRHWIRLHIPEPYRPSLPFGRVNVSAFANMTRHLGLPAATVTAKVDERTGEYDIRYPPSATLRTNLQRAIASDSLLSLLEDLGDYGTSLLQALHASEDRAARPVPAFLDRVAAAANGWNLTPREAQTLSALVRGLSNKEIASQLGCAVATAEKHVKRLLSKARVHGRGELTARFWSEF